MKTRKILSAIAALTMFASVIPQQAMAADAKWFESSFDTDYSGWEVSTIEGKTPITAVIADGALTLSGATSADSALKAANPAPESDLLYMSFDCKNSTTAGLRLFTTSGDAYAAGAAEWLGMINQNASGHMFLRNPDNSTTGAKIVIDNNFYTSPQYHQYDYVIDFETGKHYLYYEGQLKMTASVRSAFNNIYLTTHDSKAISIDNFVFGDYDAYITDYVNGLASGEELSEDAVRILTIASARLHDDSAILPTVNSLLGITGEDTTEVTEFIDSIDYTVFDYAEVVSKLNAFKEDYPSVATEIQTALDKVNARVEYLQNIQDTTVALQSQNGFTSTFDDRKDFEEDGWKVLKAATKVDITDGALDIYEGDPSNYNGAAAWHKGINATADDTVYIKFDLKTSQTIRSLRIFDSAAATGEIFGMLNSGVYLRDKSAATEASPGTATYAMVSGEKYWPTNQYHTYEIIINNKDMHSYLIIDDEQYLDLGNKGEVIRDIYLTTSSGGSKGTILIDEFTLTTYKKYLSDEISNANIYASDIYDVLDAINAKAEYLSDAEASEIAALIDAKKEEADSAAQMTNAFTAYSENTNKSGAKELFILNDDIAPVSIEVNGKELVKDSDYRVNISEADGNTYYLFNADVFEVGENQIFTYTASKTYKDTIIIEERSELIYDVLKSDKSANDHMTFVNKENLGVGAWMKDYSYHGDVSYIAQVYNNPTTIPSITLQDSEISGTYEVFWYDISALHSSLGQLACAKLNIEISSVAGVNTVEYSTLRNSTWQSMGIYEFSGNEGEYIKVAPANNVTSASRFVAEGFKLVEPIDDSKLEKVFNGAVDGWDISVNENSSNYYDEAQLINIPESLDADDVAEVYVNGKNTTAYEVKQGMILLGAENFTQTGTYSVSVKNTNSSVSETIALEIGDSVIYTINDENAELGSAGVLTSGKVHSRNAKTQSYKVPLKSAFEANKVDEIDNVYVEWTLPEDFREGDYLVDTWLSNANLAIETKAVITHTDESVEEYHSMQAGGLYSYDSSVNYYQAMYFGNGSKIHLEAGDKIKLTVDNDWENHSGQSFLVDSIRITPYHDLESAYKAFYGEDGVVLDNNATLVNERGLYINASTVYGMAKYGYTAYLAVYDGDTMIDIVKSDNVVFKDFDTLYDLDSETIQLGFRTGVDYNADYTYKVFVWGGDANPLNDTSMKPYADSVVLQFN